MVLVMLVGRSWVGRVCGARGTLFGGKRIAAETKDERREKPARMAVHMTCTYLASMIESQSRPGTRRCEVKSSRFAYTAIFPTQAPCCGYA